MTDTNQASEDVLIELATKFDMDEYGTVNENGGYLIGEVRKLIRTEKLKLLDEVRERVIGEDVKESNYVLNMGIAHNPPKDTTRTNLIRQGANLTKAEQRENLTKLEAEL